MKDKGLIALIIIIAVLAIINHSYTTKPQPSEPGPYAQHPTFVQNFIMGHEYGGVYSFRYHGHIYYSFLTSFAPGSGATIYDSNGNKVGSCNASTGPEYSSDICDNGTDPVKIWENMYEN